MYKTYNQERERDVTVIWRLCSAQVMETELRLRLDGTSYIKTIKVALALRRLPVHANAVIGTVLENPGVR